MSPPGTSAGPRRTSRRQGPGRTCSRFGQFSSFLLDVPCLARVGRSVRGGLGSAVDDQDLHRSARRLELEAELLLQRGENRRPRRGGAWILSELEIEIEG